MHSIKRTNCTDQDFIALVNKLDAELAQRDGEDHEFYNKFNSIDNIKYALVAYSNDKAIACGALKKYSTDTLEIKRMYTLPEFRGKGLAKNILSSLEFWALELGFSNCILETGKRNPEAIALYKKYGYSSIPNYGQYINVENSLCFKKTLAKYTN